MRLLIATGLLFAASPAAAGGCDVDSLPGISCCFMVDCMIDSAWAVGGARELSKRVAKAGYQTLVVSRGGQPVQVVRFDEKGRYVSLVDEWVRRYTWDEAGRLTSIQYEKSEKPIGGDDGSCTIDEQTCSLKGAEFSTSSKGKAPSKSPVSGTQVKDPKTQQVVLAVDDQGRIAKTYQRTFTYEPKQTTINIKYLETDGVETWKLNDQGLPESEAQSGFTYKWLKAAPPTPVKVIDGTCPKGKGCKNPGVDAAVAALSPDKRLTITRGDPAKNARAATEVLYRGLTRDLALDISKQLGVAAQPKATTWGDDFDILVVVGPAAK